MNFRIQIVPACGSNSGKYVYLLDGVEFNTVEFRKDKNIKSAVFEFISHGGSVWYDEIGATRSCLNDCYV